MAGAGLDAGAGQPRICVGTSNSGPLSPRRLAIAKIAPSMQQNKTLLEAALQYERALVLVLALVTLASWAWIVLMADDMHGTMMGPSAWMMMAGWEVAYVLRLWVMWAVMMIAMMLPSATPFVLLYAGAVRGKAGDDGTGALDVYALAAGYLLVWGAFSVAATVLQRLLSEALILTPMMESGTPVMTAAVLALAGVYQLTPLKRTCLRVCRSPLSYMLQHWRPGRLGALRMGIEHGAYCLGCCWALMLLLFVGGVMNLTVIVALTLWVIAEKYLPFGEWTARASGIVLLALAAWTAIG
jgi:predicted metal-binding membrane protein